ncbi:sister chromatid cohesion 1 protein 3 [Capsella rubella]|uniref:sister chromatid cohesion 1 protein 3 n=1 Tax=Capsella rubella TaxID=81985 RepID=UPI000CD56AFC|nr:sister chromatid cohesion 1 protein 3 [Capsella rubella]
MTLWLAAHVPHLLNKCQYKAMNIPETVDLIMDPEQLLPMSAIMLGAIRVGVARILSKKLDHMYSDYNHLRTKLEKALTIPQVNLPEDVRKAPVELITLPHTLHLDELDLEDHDTVDMEFDNHLFSEKDVDFADQIPTGVDPYVAITFDEDIIPETNQMDVDQVTVPPVSENLGETDVEMAYEGGPNNELGKFNVALDTGTYRPSNLTEALNPTNERSNTSSPGSVPEIEKRRDAAHALSPVSHPSYNAQQHNVRVEHTESLDETLKDQETTVPSFEEEVLNSRGHSTFELRLGSPSFVGSGEEPANFVHPSPELVLQPTTPPPPQTRPRKRKHYDEARVLLSNKIIKKRLEDPTNTVRKRKKLPSSRVGFWRLDNQSKKNQLFNHSLFTGFSNVLRSLFDKDCVASKPYLAVTDETFQEPASVPASSPTQEAETEINPASPVPQSLAHDSTKLDSTVLRSPSQQTEDVQGVGDPQSVHEKYVAAESQSPQSFSNDDMGIEHFRDGGFPNYIPSPPPRSSPYRSDDFTTQPQTWETPGPWETRSYRTEPSTSTVPEDLPGLRNPGLSAIPEMTGEELSFLEVGGNTPVRSPSTQDFDGLSGRTRAVAEYITERSSSSPNSSHPSEDLSLSKILEGKTRKIAARMFYETLVLKSRGLIDMKQDQPYSDITLKLMPALSSKVKL